MPRPSRITKQEKPPLPKAMGELLREIEMEAASWSEVSKGTRLVYEAGAAKLSEGWDMGTARKKTRYVMRACGLWVMRRQLKRTMTEAKKLLKHGTTGKELGPVREAMWAAKVSEAGTLLERIRAFQALPWNEVDDPKAHHLEADHKKTAATDAQLLDFYKAAERSTFRDAFLVAEFSGCRGEELGKGVKVETVKKNGSVALRFFIEGAKADGAKKGLAIRCVEVDFPSQATKEVQRRFHDLAKLGLKNGGGRLVKLSGTDKQAPGVRFTNACKTTAKAAGVDVSAYSLRHRFSAQLKAANPGDAECVALALGHQTTETQRHYARATRGKGGISPVQASGINIGGVLIRGSKTRSGPPIHSKERVSIARSVRGVSSPSARASRRL
jgi:integrase